MTEIVILSAYDAVSHRYWRNGLAAYLKTHLTDAEVNQVVLPARHFSWRSRGNSLSFANHPKLQQSCDLLIATSMTDLSALRGLNRFLSQVPAVVYFHENQFAYPDTHERGLLERQLTSIYTGLSGDRLLFNSEYNRSTFLEGAQALLSKMPDEVPPGVVAELAARSHVLPVAINELTDAPLFTTQTMASEPCQERLKIAWNHRWEDDKGTDDLLSLINALLLSGMDFELSLFGQQFRQVPAALQTVLQRLTAAGRLAHQGYVENRTHYLTALSRHDVILSTAKHEFQGLAVLEAMVCGCLPVVPDALCYPEYVPDEYRYSSLENARDILANIQSGRGTDVLSLDAYSWRTMGPAWLENISNLVQIRLR